MYFAIHRIASTSSTEASHSSAQLKDKGKGKKFLKYVHEDSLSDEEFDSKNTLKELIAAIKRKPQEHSASPKLPFLAGYGVHIPIHIGGPAAGLFFLLPPPRHFPPFPGNQYFMPTAAYPYHPMPLDLLYNGHDPDPTDDSTESLQEDNVNESLGHLEEENPNLADPLTDPILDHAATSLHHWFCIPCPHPEIMDLLKQVEHPANCEGLKIGEINDEVKCTMKKLNIDCDKKIKYLATGLCKGAQPLSIACSNLSLP